MMQIMATSAFRDKRYFDEEGYGFAFICYQKWDSLLLKKNEHFKQCDYKYENILIHCRKLSNNFKTKKLLRENNEDIYILGFLDK